MLTFLFWNLNKRPLQGRIARLVSTHDVDVLMLAECDSDPTDIEVLIRATSGRLYHFAPSQGDRIQVFVRLPVSSLIDLFNDPLGGLSIRRLELVGLHRLLLAVVHFPSRVNWDQGDQTLEATTLARDIADIEDEHGNRHTILVGDFNMNPFDLGVVGAQALHAVMTKDLARREARDVRGRPYRFFYNPMWGCFGDRTEGPPGTFYLRTSKPGNYFWNIYDQVLLRPTLMDLLVDLRILDTDGYDGFLTSRGLPKESDGSDHLPLLFRLKL